jgi:3alpha(or 20beta)-hydroxysteroid dehydrogenase
VEDEMRRLQPSGRFVPPDAVVDAIIFLLSDRSSFVNGSEFLVDNGFLAQ